MNEIFTVCEKCGRPYTFHTQDKTFKYNCCGLAQVADHVVNSSGEAVPPEPTPAPAPAPKGAPKLSDKDGDGDVDEDDVDTIVARVKAAE